MCVGYKATQFIQNDCLTVQYEKDTRKKREEPKMMDNSVKVSNDGRNMWKARPWRARCYCLRIGLVEGSIVSLRVWRDLLDQSVAQRCGMISRARAVVGRQARSVCSVSIHRHRSAACGF